MRRARQRYQYRAELGELGLAKILYTIHQHDVPGVVRVVHDGAVRQIYVRNGEIVHAASSELSDSLGSWLIEAGLISSDEYQQVRRQGRSTSRPMGQRLIDRGLLSPSVVGSALKRHVEAIVWRTFAWERGEVTFMIGEFDEPVPSTIRLPVRLAIKLGIRQFARPLELVAKLGPDSRYALRADVEDLIALEFDSVEMGLIKRIDGRARVRDLCSSKELSPVDSARILYALRVLNLLRTEREASADGAARSPGSRRPGSQSSGSGGIRIRLST